MGGAMIHLKIPDETIADYLRWLKEPQGIVFRFSMLTEDEQIEVSIPFVETRRGGIYLRKINPPCTPPASSNAT